MWKVFKVNKKYSSKTTVSYSSTLVNTYLTHFKPMYPFYTPKKRQKTFGFLTSSGGIEREHWPQLSEWQLVNILLHCFSYRFQQAITYIWDKAFKSGLSKFFKGSLPQNFTSSLLNTLSHIFFSYKITIRNTIKSNFPATHPKRRTEIHGSNMAASFPSN